MSELEGHFNIGTGWPLRKDEPGDNRGRGWLRIRFARFAYAAVAVVAAGVILAWYYWTNPRPVLEISDDPPGVSDLHFSPNGLTLAVSRGQLGTEIFSVTDGTPIHKLVAGTLRCAWNVDGSLLAIARDNWPDIELWNPGTWTLQKRLSLYDPKKARPKRESPYGLTCYSLCFDRWNDLYVGEWSNYGEEFPNSFPYEIPTGCVFWRASDARSDIQTDHFPDVANAEGVTRLATSGWTDAAGQSVEIWKVQTPKTGLGVIQRMYAIPQLSGEHMSVSLTPDGKYLVACSKESFFLVELLSDHAAVIHTQRVDGRFPLYSTTDVAGNGAFAAFRGSAKASVLEIPSARTVLTIWGAGPVALSPNGNLLATTTTDWWWWRRAVRIYQVPQ
jgi:hypothetical protein